MVKNLTGSNCVILPTPGGEIGRFYRFDASQTGIKPCLSELDITGGISEIKLLIPDFSILDFRFSGITICEF